MDGTNLMFNKQLFRFLALSIRRGNFQAIFVSATVSNCSLAALITDLTRFLILLIPIPILHWPVSQFKDILINIGLNKNHFRTEFSSMEVLNQGSEPQS